MAYQWLATVVLVLHAAFVLFAVFGGLLVLRWPRAAWLHLPAAAWAALVEFGGWICPLTPLEIHFRHLAGQGGYAGGFIDHYLIEWLYPAGFTRGVQAVLGLAVVAFNATVYAWVLRSRRKRPTAG